MTQTCELHRNELCVHVRELTLCADKRGTGLCSIASVSGRTVDGRGARVRRVSSDSSPRLFYGGEL